MVNMGVEDVRSAGLVRAPGIGATSQSRGESAAGGAMAGSVMTGVVVAFAGAMTFTILAGAEASGSRGVALSTIAV